MDIAKAIKEELKLPLVVAVVVIVSFLVNLDLVVMIKQNLVVSFSLTYLIIQVAARGSGLLKPPVIKLAFYIAAWELVIWFIEHQMNFLVLRKPILLENYIFLIIYVTITWRIGALIVDAVYDTILEKK